MNNAGVFEPRRAVDVDEELWDRIVDVDLKALFFHAQAAARHMIEAGRDGRIINVSSVSALRPIGAMSPYEAAKGGIISLSRSLAKEFGEHGITVNSIVVGSVVTPGTTTAGGKFRDLLGEGKVMVAGKVSLLGLRGEPADVANAAYFLASDLAAFVTGSAMLVDGGYVLV